jgi:hypothetical protein
MSATSLYRIAAVLLVLFAAGHTMGFLGFKPATQEGVAVKEAMEKVHFQIGGSSFTYGGFYVGFGLYATVYLLFSAFLAWHLGGLAARDPQAIGALGWVFFAAQLAGFALSWIYFAAPPAVLAALVTICVGWAALLVKTAA